MISRVMLYSIPSGADIIAQVDIGKTPMAIDKTLLESIPSGTFRITYPKYRDLTVENNLQRVN